ncbi:MAG: hypothetical protein JRH18_11325 [Deltaproteobacteria bacterium]|nr:hypothetical protein [Deltaproteobacteria bacterium]MBW1961814.1 hypothetical protein [Deltaproteobacteria bacterium]MBW2152248.1 hypothetical protein [Deltaproteobacteria bacterium]
MEIVIGATAKVGPPPKKAPSPAGGYIEAKVLNVRPPRRRQLNPPGPNERRHNRSSNDPASGRVMVLLIPEGYNLPPDIGSGNYRIFLRFVPNRK